MNNFHTHLIAVVDRDRKDLGDIAALAEDIKLNTQLTAGVVRQAVPEDKELWDIDPDKTPFVLVAGERRYRACVMAGLTFLAIDRGELDPLTQKIYELAENLHRKDLTWDEEATMRKKIHEILVQRAQESGDEWFQKDTARYLGESVATVSRDIEVAAALELDPGLKDAGSKKAATRILDMREHIEQRMAHSATEAKSLGKLKSLIRTDDANNDARHLATGSVALVLTDFPYAIGMDAMYKVASDAARPVSEYDDSEGVTLDLYANLVPELLRVTRTDGWIISTISESSYDPLREFFETCCTTHFDYGEIVWEQEVNGDWFKHLPTACRVGTDDTCAFVRAEVPRWIWHRPNSRNPTRTPDLHAKNFYEPILVINRGSGKLYLSQCSNVLTFETEYGDERTHIMQKPIALAQELVQRTTLPGDLVYDPFYGSGRLLAGAASLHRRISGCDKNPLLLETAIVKIAPYFGG